MSEIRPKFRSANDVFDSEKIFTDPGSPIQPVYAEKIDPDTLEPSFVKVGEEDLDELHRRDLDGCDINMLAKRYFLGDIACVEKMANVFYGDTTQMPKDSLEAANQMLFARQSFDLLPIDLKEKFGNNYLKWLAAVDSMDKDTLVRSGLGRFAADEPTSAPVEPKGDVE